MEQSWKSISLIQISQDSNGKKHSDRMESISVSLKKQQNGIDTLLQLFYFPQTLNIIEATEIVFHFSF